MSVGTAVPLISAAVAFASAVATALLGAQAAQRLVLLKAEIDSQQIASRKQEERQDLMNRIRDPVLWAAFDLQSRIFNIVAQRFLEAYLQYGSPGKQSYAVRNTAFLFGQYLAWVEIVREKVQFLDLGNKQENRKVVDHFFNIGGILNSDGFRDQLFCIFRGDQRAIGEIMLDNSAEGELQCVGYAEFCSRMDVDPSFAQWFTGLSVDIEQLSDNPNPNPHPRLVALQNLLVDLINLLDPDSIRFPEWHRTKLERTNFRR